MNFIDNYLQREHFLDLKLNGLDKTSQQDAKLEYFYRLFVELENKYATKIEDMKRLELEHKSELNELENYVYKVKQLTEERENLTIDFKEENDELKNKIKSLERELVNNNNKQIDLKKHDNKSNKMTSDTTSSFSDEDLSEATIEMLVLEGFGSIVSLPNHEKIAVLLTDRSKLVDELKQIKIDYEASKELINEIESLKLVNEKLTNEILQLKNQITNLEDVIKENEVILVENVNFKVELNKLQNVNEPKKLIRSAQTSVDLEEDNLAFIEASKFEINKLKEDNVNLKLEMDKLYDEIGQFEIDNKQLKDENKKLMSELDGLNDLAVSLKKSEKERKHESSKEHLEEIKKLKQEIFDLNNELDDLVQFKDNYENLKLEHDKLNATIQLNSEKPQSDKNGKPNSQQESSLPDQSKNKTQLELEWIRSENEKLLLDLERTQMKLDDKIEKYNELKQQLVGKDEQMNEFINKYEKKQTNEDDVLKLQKKIIETERLLNKEKEEHLVELESNEERQKDLLKRNDQLWAQSNKMEKNYKEAMEIIRQQTERIASLDSKIIQLEKRLTELDDSLKQEKLINENIYSKNESLELKLENLTNNLEESKEINSKLNKEKLDNMEENKTKIKNLNLEIEDLNEKLKELEKSNSNLKLEIDSLNKEKTFIIGQNDATHQKVLQDYFSLQEKYTNVNYEFNKLSKDFQQNVVILKEKETLFNQLEIEKNQLDINFKHESRDKYDLLEKLKHFENTISQNLETINELNDKIHKIEIQKSKLEFKAKELDSMENKCEQISTELNDKRETLSQILEKNGKLEGQINDLEQQLNNAKHSIIQSEAVQNELNSVKNDLTQKIEETIKFKHDHENEKNRREKAESRIEEIRDEYKKLKLKLIKIQEENTNLKQETIESKNQLEGFKSKLNLIADKSHTEVEKNNALQDELSELKKLLELAEIKCSSYSDKFDLLLKKYEGRKIKQKNKIERLWNYLQRERVKYKELLVNAQNDLANKKANSEKENDFKIQQDNSYQQLVDEKSKLIAVMVDKDAKIREMKRQNILLQSKIKLLEDEMDNLHEKIDSTLKERNKLRKEIQMNLVNQMSPASDILETSLSNFNNNSPTHKSSTHEQSTNNNTMVSNFQRTVSVEPLDKSFKSTSSLNVNYWNELNNNNNANTNSANWDVNYNTGYISKYNRNSDITLKSIMSQANTKFNMKPNKNEDANFGGSMATDFNSITSTPRTFR